MAGGGGRWARGTVLARAGRAVACVISCAHRLLNDEGVCGTAAGAGEAEF